jgi:hypothetical protein
MKFSLFILLSTLMCFHLHAQVGIGTVNPSNAANLEVSGSTSGLGPYRGFMPPRVRSNLQRDAIPATSADVGLVVFVLETGCLELWDGDSWENVGSCFTVPPLPVEPWINEFHYDNISTDVSEGIEIAGPAGVDLSDYAIILYTGGTTNSYDNVILSGTIDDEGSAFGALWFGWPQDGLQNGAPDGIALYKVSTGTLIQFISYEGSFTAGNDIGIGAISTDVGFAESNVTTPVGFSIQLTGSGNRYTDFNWNAPAAKSEGSLNIGQIIL